MEISKKLVYRGRTLSLRPGCNDSHLAQNRLAKFMSETWVWIGAKFVHADQEIAGKSKAASIFVILPSKVRRFFHLDRPAWKP